VKRTDPEKRSKPTVDNRNPNIPDIKPLSFEVPASNTTKLSPRIIRPAYSGGPKMMASSATAGARNVSPIRPTVPAMNEPIAAIPRAGPARPCLAIW
jgi:hypothetical protein